MKNPFLQKIPGLRNNLLCKSAQFNFDKKFSRKQSENLRMGWEKLWKLPNTWMEGAFKSLDDPLLGLIVAAQKRVRKSFLSSVQTLNNIGIFCDILEGLKQYVFWNGYGSEGSLFFDCTGIILSLDWLFCNLNLRICYKLLCLKNAYSFPYL